MGSIDAVVVAMALVTMLAKERRRGRRDEVINMKVEKMCQS